MILSLDLLLKFEKLLGKYREFPLLSFQRICVDSRSERCWVDGQSVKQNSDEKLNDSDRLF